MRLHKKPRRWSRDRDQKNRKVWGGVSGGVDDVEGWNMLECLKYFFLLEKMEKVEVL